jgi:hypothetical protein
MAYITLHLLGGSRSLRLERRASSVREEVGMLAGISVAWIPLWLRSLCVSRPGDGCLGGNHMTRASRHDFSFPVFGFSFPFSLMFMPTHSRDA